MPPIIYGSVAYEWALVSQWDEVIFESVTRAPPSSKRTTVPSRGQGPRLQSAPTGPSPWSGLGTDPRQTDVHHATFNFYPISLSPPACLPCTTINIFISPEIIVK